MSVDTARRAGRLVLCGLLWVRGHLPYPERRRNGQPSTTTLGRRAR